MFHFFPERDARGGPRPRGDVVHVALLLARHPAAQVERAAQPRRDLREDRRGTRPRGQQAAQPHVLPGTGLADLMINE